MTVDSGIALDQDVFEAPSPKREWLVRCENGDGVPAVCAIAVNRGDIELTGPDDGLLTLTPSDLVEFRDALVAAFSQATADIRAAR